MPLTAQQAASLAIFRTLPLDPESKDFVLAWKQFLQSIVQTQDNQPKMYLLTRAARLAMLVVNLTLGSIVFETDTPHILIWNGSAWVQLV